MVINHLRTGTKWRFQVVVAMFNVLRLPSFLASNLGYVERAEHSKVM